MQLEPSFPPGTEVAGKYVVERRLGAGGMGVVLAVRHKELGERYALKLMLPAASASEPARERFAREAKAAARLKSEHVARAIDFGFLSDGGAPFMVLELLEGQNLAERLSERGPLEPREIARLMLDACDALREAHAEGIVHRDLKPANLFCTPRRDGTSVLKVLDFGIAKTLSQDSAALTKTATTMGSPFYMSPEQMRSAKSADARSDVWSLGVTMFELATGHLPFVGETVTEVAILVIEAAVPSPTIYVPDLPPAFVQIILRCLQKDPARRYADVEDLAEELAAFVGETWTRTSPKRVVSIVPSGASTDPSAAFARTESPDVAAPPTVAAEPLVTSPSLSPPPRRRSAALLAAGVVGVGVVATAIYVLPSSPTQVRVGGGFELSDVATNAPTPAETAVTSSVAYVSSSAAPTAPLPTRTRDDLMRALGGDKGRLEQCYQRASVATRTKTNELEFVLTIAPDGSLATNPTIKGAHFEQIDRDCFVAALRRVSFPPGSAQDVLEDKIVVGRKPSVGGASVGGVGAGEFVQRPIEQTDNIGPRPKGGYGLPRTPKDPRAAAGE
jgi:serine/threonine-protein kinase